MVPQLFLLLSLGFLTYTFIVWYAFKLKIPALNVKDDPNKFYGVMILSIILAFAERVLLMKPAETWMIIIMAGVALTAYYFMKPAMDKQKQQEREKAAASKEESNDNNQGH